MQLLILGPPAAGTSLVTRLLSRLGAYFAPQGGPSGGAAAGEAWQRDDVRELNDALLFSAGADWDRLGAFAPEAIPSAAQQAFDSRAARLVLDLDAHRPWLLHDVRLCLLLPSWRPLLEMPVVVLVHRRPEEVAASLRARHDMPLAVGLALWERYMADALASSADLPRIVTSHERLLADGGQEVARILEGLRHHGCTGLRAATPRELQGLLAPTAAETAAAPPADPLTAAQQSLGELLDTLAALPPGETAPTTTLALSETAAEILSLYDRSREPRVPEQSRAGMLSDLAALRSRYETLVLQHQDTTEKQQLLLAELAVVREENETLTRRNRGFRDRNRKLQVQTSTQRDRTRQLIAELRRRTEQLERQKRHQATIEQVLHDMHASRSWKLASKLSAGFGLLRGNPKRS